MNRPRVRIVNLVAPFVLAALTMAFGPAATLNRRLARTSAARIATTIGATILLALRFVFRHQPAGRNPTEDFARRWRELDLLRETLDAVGPVPAAIQAHLDNAYEYLILGREPGAARWHARQVERWIRYR